MIKYKDKELLLSYYKDNEIKGLIYTDNIIFGKVNLSDWEEYYIEQVAWTVDLNNQWELATVRQDKDTNFQTYQSFSNKGVNNGWARMKVNIAKGLSEFTLHFGSYAEGNYDYTLVGNLDADMSTSVVISTGTTSTTWKDTSKGKQSTSAPNLTATYTIADTSKEHFIWIAYRKDGSSHASDDRGYVSFDKRLVQSFDGFRKKEYSYSAQTISDYVYDFYLAEKWVYSEDKETIIKEDPLTATTTQLETRLIDGEDTDTFQYGNYIYYKKYYQVKINNQWLNTDYFTFGEIKEEIKYSENSYIIIDGVHYFNTNYIPKNPNMSFEVKLRTPSSINGNVLYTVFGARTNWDTTTEQNTYQFSVGADDGIGNSYRLGSISTDSYGRFRTEIPQTSTIYKITASSNLITEEHNGEIKTYTPDFNFSGCNYPIWIGWLNSGGSGTDNKYPNRIYYLKFFEDGKLVHYYTPALKDGVYCFYDVITNDYLKTLNNAYIVQGYIE